MSWALFGLVLLVHTTGSAQLSQPAAPPGSPTDLVATVSGSTVSFDWIPAIGAAVTGYTLEAALIAGGPAIASLPVSVPTLTVNGVPNGVYFVRVRAFNGDGTGPVSNEVTVVVGPGGCASVPAAPGTLSSIVDGGTLSLQWSAPIGGCAPTNYLLQAGSAPMLTDVASMTLGLQTALAAQAPPGTYFIRMLAVNAFGQSQPSNEVVAQVGVTCTPPGPPQGFVATAAGASALFQWAAPLTGDAPSGYLLEAGTAPTLSDIGVLPLPVHGFSFSTPAPSGSYFVRIRGRNDCGTGPASPTELLTIVCTAPGTPSTPSASVFGSTATISWNAIGAATQYRLEVGTAAGSSNISNQTISGTSRQLSGLAEGTYFMRVRAINACGSSASSAEGVFTIAAPPSSASCGGAPAPAVVTCINGGHQGAPTARCRDGVWSCSQNRSGTCSSHGGVSCWVCPGLLC